MANNNYRDSVAGVETSKASAHLALQQQAAINYRPVDWDSLSPAKQAAWETAVEKYWRAV